MIKVQNLVKTFGDFQAVKGISFEVKSGEIFAFLGPNGAGKTTTIKMLTTILKPSGGSILIDGFDPVKDQHEVRRRIGIVFQDPSLDSELTCYENMDMHGVLYGLSRRTRAERIESLMKLFDMWQWHNQVTKQLSGGMKRRLEIARALMHTPKVLFMDEPTLGLDPQSRGQLWAQVKLLNETGGVTVFLTTHYMDEVERVAQRIAVIDHGVIIGQGSLHEFQGQTPSRTLEAAFLALTGSAVRDEQPNSTDQMREMARAWSAKR